MNARQSIVEDCAEEAMVLAQSLSASSNSYFELGDQGSAIVSRFRSEGAKMVADLLFGLCGGNAGGSRERFLATLERIRMHPEWSGQHADLICGAIAEAIAKE